MQPQIRVGRARRRGIEVDRDVDGLDADVASLVWPGEREVLGRESGCPAAGFAHEAGVREPRVEHGSVGRDGREAGALSGAGRSGGGIVCGHDSRVARCHLRVTKRGS